MRSHFTPASVGKKTMRSHFISGAAIACAVTGATAMMPGVSSAQMRLRHGNRRHLCRRLVGGPKRRIRLRRLEL